MTNILIIRLNIKWACVVDGILIMDLSLEFTIMNDAF